MSFKLALQLINCVWFIYSFEFLMILLFKFKIVCFLYLFIKKNLNKLNAFDLLKLLKTKD